MCKKIFVGRLNREWFMILYLVSKNSKYSLLQQKCFKASTRITILRFSAFYRSPKRFSILACFRLKFSISVQLKGSNHAIKIKVSTINFIHGLFIWRWIKIITRLKGWKEVVLIYVCSTFSKKKNLEEE